MRSKLAMGALGVTVAFLLATNPVVVNAAGQISSGQIKNNSIKSKDIKDNQIKGADVKNGSLAAADLAAGTIPGEQIKLFKRLPATPLTVPSGTRQFAAPPVTVTVTTGDLIVVDSVLEIVPSAIGATIDLAVCYRTAGAVTAPLVLDPQNLFDQNASHTNETAYPVLGSGSLAAGSYEVGPCTQVFNGTHSLQTVEGTAMVLSGATAGPFSKPTAPKPESRS